MNRSKMISQLEGPSEVFDFPVIGEGAAGIGTAPGASTGGYRIALFEQLDFTKGISGRSTKLVRGGVRYLAQGDVSLVPEALHERDLLHQNAPHLVKDQTFLISCHRWWEGLSCTIGPILYDTMAGKLDLGRSVCIGSKRALRTIPMLRSKGITAGMPYHDGQFDDPHLVTNIVRNSIDAGICILNYAKVIGLLEDDDHKVSGVTIRDEETSTVYQVRSRCVINVTGVFADKISQMDEPGKCPTVCSSQRVYLVLDSSLLQSGCVIMIPETLDGRVLFAVPQHGKVVVGITDTLVESPEEEPVVLEKEIQFILDTATSYSIQPPGRSDVSSMFTGFHLLAAPHSEGKGIKEISRSHKLIREKSGLITTIGGR